MSAKDLMSEQVEVAKEDAKIEQISAKLFAGEFNGISIVNDNDSVIGIVTAIDVLKAIREGKSLNAMTAKDNDPQSIRNKKRYANKRYN